VLVIQGNEMNTFPDFPIYRVTQKYASLKSARGHSYKACELALKQLSSHRFPLEKAITHTFGLKEVDWAIKSVAGKGAEDVIHVFREPVEGRGLAALRLATPDRGRLSLAARGRCRSHGRRPMQGGGGQRRPP